MDERLTWDEIKRRFPDEYVVLIDAELDQNTDVVAATVVNHGKSKQEMRSYLGQLDPKSGACLWTGEPRGLLSPVRRAGDR
ncbi:MAG: hypothetical protein HY815_22400 [Candidatus Riflebacteria bacterium]|nr:hypothetical protein [Candidatus Riflebacteria bacterium]